MVQHVERPTPDLSSGRDLMVCGIAPPPPLGSVLTVWSPLRILFLPLSLPLPCSCFLSLSQNKQINVKNKIT